MPFLLSRSIFYSSLLGLLLFEVAKVNFIMPMPGSRLGETLALAYALHQWRWAVRGVLAILVLMGVRSAFSVRWKWMPSATLLVVVAVAYATTGPMMADVMFKKPGSLKFSSPENSNLSPESLVMGLVLNGEAKAFPIQLMAYHH